MGHHRHKAVGDERGYSKFGPTERANTVANAAAQESGRWVDTPLGDVVPPEVAIAAKTAQTISENRELLALELRVAAERARSAGESFGRTVAHGAVEAARETMKTQIGPQIDPVTQMKINEVIAAERRANEGEDAHRQHREREQP